MTRFLITDGGIVCNSPILEVVKQNKGKNTLVYQIDLWNSKGNLPKNFDDVSHRIKDIQYSSRNKEVEKLIESYNEQANATASLINMMTPEQLADNSEQLQYMKSLANPTNIRIEHMVYQHQPYENSSKDYEFSIQTMREHWKVGLSDMKNKLNIADNINKKSLF